MHKLLRSLGELLSGGSKRRDISRRHARAYRCRCGNQIFFRNSQCLNCQAVLGYIPLDAELPESREAADQILDEAQALLETYAGVQITSRLERARSAGPAIVEEAARRDAEVVILGAPRAKVKGGKPIFGRTVDYVLRNSPTRVAVIAGKQAA